MQTIEQLEVEWTTFREKNAEEKNGTAALLDEVIVSLQEKKTAMMMKYDEFEKLAEERLKWLREAKETEKVVQDLQKSVAEKEVQAIQQAQTIAERCNEFMSISKRILAEPVPDNLDSVYTRFLSREISTLGSQILRRKAGEDQDCEIVWSRNGAVWKCDPGTDFPQQKLVEGRTELVRFRGGKYTLRVVDRYGRIKWSSETWNNQDDALPSMYTTPFRSHLPWWLKKGDEEVVYSTETVDDEIFCSFKEAMTHSWLEGYRS